MVLYYITHKTHLARSKIARWKYSFVNEIIDCSCQNQGLQLNERNLCMRTTCACVCVCVYANIGINKSWKIYCDIVCSKSAFYLSYLKREREKLWYIYTSSAPSFTVQPAAAATTVYEMYPPLYQHLFISSVVRVARAIAAIIQDFPSVLFTGFRFARVRNPLFNAVHALLRSFVLFFSRILFTFISAPHLPASHALSLSKQRQRVGTIFLSIDELRFTKWMRLHLALSYTSKFWIITHKLKFGLLVFWCIFLMCFALENRSNFFGFYVKINNTMSASIFRSVYRFLMSRNWIW